VSPLLFGAYIFISILTLGRRKIPVFVANIVPCVRRGVQDLHIGCEVLVAPDAADLVEGLKGSVGEVELMIAWDRVSPNDAP